MRQRSFAAPAPFCPVRDGLANVLDRWSLLIVMALSQRGRCRFSALQETIPDISPRMLTVTLRRLQAAQVILRLPFAEAPPRVDYKLSTNGKALAEALKGLCMWGEDQAAVEQGQPSPTCLPKTLT